MKLREQGEWGGVEARVCLPRLTSRLAGSHRRALDVGRDFIWDLPMTLLLNLSNICLDIEDGGRACSIQFN